MKGLNGRGDRRTCPARPHWWTEPSPGTTHCRCCSTYQSRPRRRAVIAKWLIVLPQAPGLLGIIGWK